MKFAKFEFREPEGMLFRIETRPLALEELYSKADQLPAFTLLQAFRYCT